MAFLTRFCINTWVVFLMTTSVALAQISQSLPYQEVSVSVKNGNTVFSGSALTNDPGRPQIPFYTITFLLPADADQKKVSVALQGGVETELSGTYNVNPALPASAFGEVTWPKDRVIVGGKDVGIYGASQFYPTSTVGQKSFGLFREYKLLEVTIFPIRYNPVTGKLRQITGGQVVVTGMPSASSISTFALPAASVNGTSFSGRNQKKVYEMIANKGQLSSYTSTVQAQAAPVASANGRYVIMTTQQIVQSSTQLQNFISHKQAHGYTVQVVTEETWNYQTGDAAANAIRAWLKANYLSLNIEYVLLIGDPNASSQVPMKMCFPRPDATDGYTYAETDFFYSELSNTWDADNDGLYGEETDDFWNTTVGADKYGEITVGRIPYIGNIVELEKILAKTINYESSPASQNGWRRKVILPMEPSDMYTSGVNLGEAIKDYVLAPNQFTFHRIYDDINGYTAQPIPELATLVPPAETTPCTEGNVTSVWKNNPAGLVVWWTHGWYAGASDVMSTYSVPQLNDAKPSFTFQVSCNNAQPNMVDNLAYSILMNGGIATVGATQVSWYYPGETDFTSSGSNASMSYLFAKGLITQKLSVGDALNYVKETSSGVLWMNWLVFNVYGDPSVSLNPGSAETLTPVSVSTSSASSALSASTLAHDGNKGTRWESAHGVDPQWITFDLGSAKSISAIVIDWEAANAKDYVVEGSNDASFATKTLLVTKANMATGARTDSITGLVGSYRYYRVYGTARNLNYGYSIWEARFYTGTSGPNQIPVVDAGSDQTGTIGVAVYLDGSRSYDPDNGPQPLTYTWTPLQQPASVTLSDIHSARPSFVPSVAGIYTFQLTVSDGEAINSSYVGVTVSGQNFTLITAVVPAYTGTVMGGGSYEVGSYATVTAYPSYGYRFTGWTGDIVSSVNPLSILMNSNKTVIANFALVQYALDASAGAGGSISPSGRSIVPHGQLFTYTITPNAGYSVDQVLVDGVDVGSVTTYTFPSVLAPHTIVASFKLSGGLTKQTVSTSSASSGTPAQAHDGNIGTRWESAHGIDPQWIVYDLGSAKAISVVVFDWEAANAKNYTLEGSNDLSFATKTVLATKINMAIGQHRLDSLTGLTGSYRYYRMYGTARNLTYGYSIWETRFYTGNAGPNQVPVANAGSDRSGSIGVAITLDGSGSYDPDNGPQPLTYTWTALKYPAAVTFSDNHAAKPSFVPTADGIYTFQLTVSDGLATSSAYVGATISTTTYSLMTFVSPIGAGTVSGDGNYTSGATATITATPAAGYSFTGWTGDLTSSSNPATLLMNGNKSVTANFKQDAGLVKQTVSTSSASSGTPAQAHDGNNGTRWESAHGIDPQWIVYDLGSAKAISVVVFDWEAANAKNYTLEGSNDLSFATKTVLATKTNMAIGQHRLDSLTGLTGSYRYYRMYGTARNLTYGYSIWETRFYTGGGTPVNNGKLQFTNASFEIPEGGSSVLLMLDRVNGSDGAVSVTYTTSNGTALAGSDYTSATGTINFAAGEVSKSFSVSILEDVLSEGNETFTIALSNPTGGATLGSPVFTTVTILDNEAQTYVVQSSAGANGTISPLGTVPTNVGTSRTFTISPNIGYGVDQVNVDGTSMGAITTYTFPSTTTGTHSIYATFKQNSVVKLAISSASASSALGGNVAANVKDNNTGTRWESTHGIDPQWVVVDLGSAKNIASVKLIWEAANAKNYTLEGSNDASFATKTVLATKTNMATGARTDDLAGLSGSYRYIRMNGTARNLNYGYSIWEFEVYGN